MSTDNNLVDTNQTTELEQETMQGEKIMDIVRKVEEVIVDEQRNYIVAALLAISVAAIRPDLIENGRITDAITYLSGEIAMFPTEAIITSPTATANWMMPEQKPGRSKQDYQTPPEFLEAVKLRLSIDEFAWDLASDYGKSVTPFGCFDATDNSLTQQWTGGPSMDGWLWLNPPFADIGPWVQKCAEESKEGAHIACLIPASVGSNWWRDHVMSESYQLFLNGRLTFVGCTDAYPKDCALLLYTPFIRSGSAVWDWRKEINAEVPARKVG